MTLLPLVPYFKCKLSATSDWAKIEMVMKLTNWSLSPTKHTVGRYRSQPTQRRLLLVQMYADKGFLPKTTSVTGVCSDHFVKHTVTAPWTAKDVLCFISVVINWPWQALAVLGRFLMTWVEQLLPSFHPIHQLELALGELVLENVCTVQFGDLKHTWLNSPVNCWV